MNRTRAAAYCGVSVGKFDQDYRPHLTELEDGGVIYFLREDLEKFIKDRFKKAATWRDEKRQKRYQDSTGTQKLATGSSIKSLTDMDDFAKALERKITRKQNVARSNGSVKSKSAASTAKTPS